MVIKWPIMTQIGWKCPKTNKNVPEWFGMVSKWLKIRAEFYLHTHQKTPFLQYIDQVGIELPKSISQSPITMRMVKLSTAHRPFGVWHDGFGLGGSHVPDFSLSDPPKYILSLWERLYCCVHLKDIWKVPATKKMWNNELDILSQRVWWHVWRTLESRSGLSQAPELIEIHQIL
jgi:hypothetical protein